MKNTKYGLSPEEIEQRSLAGERFRTIFNMHRIEKTQKIHVKKYSAKRKKLRRNFSLVKKSIYLLKESERKALQENSTSNMYKISAALTRIIFLLYE